MINHYATITMKQLFFTFVLTLLASAASAKVVLPKMFSDGMVLQRETEASLWGKAERNSTVKITTSWNGKTIATKAGADGRWSAKVPTPQAGGPYSITLDDGERTTITDILAGEVWICAGQSNMEMPMKGFKNQPVDGAVEDILHSTDPQLRLFTAKRNSSVVPVDTVSGAWKQAAPAAVREFSATAYYFGRELRQVLGVPVGLIVTAWGGSSCEAWLRSDWLKAYPDAKIPKSAGDVKSKNRTPTVLFNGMLHPFIGTAIRGAIWYQGEDNVPRYKTYASMLATMIEGWRQVWGIGTFPFYYCQIAPYDYSLIGGKVNSAFLREQQAMVERLSPNCGMAVLMDAGLEKGIHPRKKRLAGERLALLALSKTYGIDGLSGESAYMKGVAFKGDTAVVSFERAQMGLYGQQEQKSRLFEMAGKDRVFHPAEAWIERSKVYVKSDSVPRPVAVRYAFKDWAVGDLFCDGLPISSFRSDDWEE